MAANSKKSQTLPTTSSRNKPLLPPKPPIRARSMTFTSNRTTTTTTATNNRTKQRLRGNSIDALLVDSDNDPIQSGRPTRAASEEPSTATISEDLITLSPHVPLTDTPKETSEETSGNIPNNSDKVDNNNHKEEKRVHKEEDSSSEEDKSVNVHDSQTVSQKSDKNTKANRPPMPSRPPPPLTRPPRPFPPPSRPPPINVSPSHSINEAKLAKKRPPPTPPLIIDTRSNNEHTPHAQRTFKEHPSPTISNNKKTSPPQRPPLPTNTSNNKVHTENDTNTQESNIPNTSDSTISDNTANVGTPIITTTADDTNVICDTDVKDDDSGHHLSVVTNEDKRDERGESNKEGATVIYSHDDSAAGRSSPQSRKLLGKMKDSIRTFSKRRHRTVHGTSSPSGDQSLSPRNWKRVFSTRNTKQQSSNDTSEDGDSKYPDKLTTGVVDPLLVQCVAYLNREDVLKEPGLFRIPGDLSVIKHLRTQFISGEFVDLSDIMDPNIITGLLKVYFREKPHPLISDRLCLNRAVMAAKNRDVNTFKEVLDDLDDVTLASLRMLSELFKKIAEYSEENHMTSGILATSCGPSFFPNTQPSNANNLIKFLTDNCDELFAE